MLNTLKYILQANEFMRLPKSMRRIVFYSEGKSYWPLFQGLIDEILDNSDLHVSYISSGRDDPGLNYSDTNYKSFLIDDSYVRNWLFENIKADVIIMTMPDLNQYQVKRSKHKVHYVYVQHALMSLHMAYREGAFDWYDTIFCAGPHHVEEIRCLEAEYKLPKKNLFEHGYSRIDFIIKHKLSKKKDNHIKNVLFAPSWGPNSAIEAGIGGLVVEKLLSLGCEVTFRPHPETVKSSFKKINEIKSKYSKDKMFIYDSCISSLDSFYNSNFMISDWSGAAIEYSLGLNKPVVFLDLPKKINNPNYKGIDLIPLEVSIREKSGITVTINEINHSLLNSLKYVPLDINKYIFNIGKSDYYGAKYIQDLLNNSRSKELS